MKYLASTPVFGPLQTKFLPIYNLSLRQRRGPNMNWLGVKSFLAKQNCDSW